jgi:bisanhydrobacterioruberin hydratase
MKEFLQDKTKRSIAFLIIIHLVGIGGMLSPYKDLFASLTPINLLVSFVVLMLNHHNLQKNWIFYLIAIYIAGFAVEAIGVNTGFPFGEYNYGKNLGPKILGTPLMIGLNWAMLIYCSSAIAILHPNNIVQAGVAATFMLLYDLNLEPSAIELGLWNWQNVSIPIQNYVSWFVIAFVMHYFLYWFLGKPENKIAKPLYLIQMIFFAIINFT